MRAKKNPTVRWYSKGLRVLELYFSVDESRPLRLDEGDLAVEVRLLFCMEFQCDAARRRDTLQHRE